MATKSRYRNEKYFHEKMKDKFLYMLENETIYMANLEAWSKILSGKLRHL